MTHYNMNAKKIVRHHTVLILIGLLWFSFGTMAQAAGGGMLRAIGSATPPVTTRGETIANGGSGDRGRRSPSAKRRFRVDLFRFQRLH